jgi:hypothetical protein
VTIMHTELCLYFVKHALWSSRLQWGNIAGTSLAPAALAECRRKLLLTQPTLSPEDADAAVVVLHLTYAP